MGDVKGHRQEQEAQAVDEEDQDSVDTAYITHQLRSILLLLRQLETECFVRVLTSSTSIPGAEGTFKVEEHITVNA